MHRLYLVLTTALILGGCAEKVTPLTPDEKARYVIELLNDDSRCDNFRQRFAVRPLAGDAIDAIYKEAMKVQCIKRDA
jgi:hypothetical protein